MAAAGDVRDRPAQDGRVVSKQPFVVAAYPQRSLSRRASGSTGVIVVFGRNCQLSRELARRAALQSIPTSTLAHAEVDIAKSSVVASVRVGRRAPRTAPSVPGAQRSGAGIEHLSRRRGGSDHLAWFCRPYRGRTGAAQWPPPIPTANHSVVARRPAHSQLDCRLFAKVFGFS